MLAGLGFRMAFELQLVRRRTWFKQGLGFKVCQCWMSLFISEEDHGGYNQSSVLQLCALLSRLVTRIMPSLLPTGEAGHKTTDGCEG